MSLAPQISTTGGPSPQLVAGLLNGACAGACWGLSLLVPLMLPGFNGLQISSARFLIYGLIALILILPRWRSTLAKLGRQDWLALLGLSLIGNIIYYVLLVWGIQWAGSGPAALIVGLVPVTITLYGMIRKGALGLRSLAAPLLLCVIGVGIVAAHSLSNETIGTVQYGIWQRAAGLIMALAALLLWTAYSIWNGHWLMRRPDISPWDWSLLIGLATGVLALLLAIPAFAPVLVAEIGQENEANNFHDWLYFWIVSGALAFFASALANNFWNRATRQLPLTMIGQMIVFETIFALIYGFLYEWRFPDLMEWLSMSALIGGMLWCMRVHQTKHR